MATTLNNPMPEVASKSRAAKLIERAFAYCTGSGGGRPDTLELEYLLEDFSELDVNSMPDWKPYIETARGIVLLALGQRDAAGAAYLAAHASITSDNVRLRHSELHKWLHERLFPVCYG